MSGNPYWGLHFGEVLFLFMQRLWLFLLGKLPLSGLAADEIQIGVLCLMGIAAALMGTFLVLKKMTMLANALSHTILLGLVIIYVIARQSGFYTVGGAGLLGAALLTAWLTTWLTQQLTGWMRLQEDASIGLVFTTLFALGVVLVTCLTRNTHIGIEAVMGNVDALHIDDLRRAGIIVLINAVAVGICFRGFTLMAFDAPFASSIGWPIAFFQHFFMALTALTILGAFRAVGVLLVLALLVGPVLTARLYTHRLKPLLGLSMGISALASLLAVALARHCLTVYHLPLSTSGILVVLLGMIYFGSLILQKRKISLCKT